MSGSDMGALTGWRVHPKAVRIMVLITIASGLCQLLAGHLDASALLRAIIMTPGVVCASFLGLKDLTIWQQVEQEQDNAEDN